MYIERQLLVSGEPNKNGRIYPRYLWDELISEIKADRVLGELDYPGSKYFTLANATHLLQNPVVKEEKIYTDIKFLEVPKGVSAHEIINAIGVDNFRLKLRWEVNDNNKLDIISADLIRIR